MNCPGAWSIRGIFVLFMPSGFGREELSALPAGFYFLLLWESCRCCPGGMGCRMRKLNGGGNFSCRENAEHFIHREWRQDGMMA